MLLCVLSLRKKLVLSDRRAEIISALRLTSSKLNETLLIEVLLLPDDTVPVLAVEKMGTFRLLH